MGRAIEPKLRGLFLRVSNALELGQASYLFSSDDQSNAKLSIEYPKSLADIVKAIQGTTFHTSSPDIFSVI